MANTQARILFVMHTSDLGGPSYSLLKLLKYIGQQLEVAVVAPGDGALFEELEHMGIPGYRAKPYGLTRRSIPWLCQLIVREKFDLVYGNNFSSGPRNALVAAKLTGRPFVWHIREMLRKRPWGKVFFLRYADVIIAVSRACAQLVKHHVPKKNVRVVYNGIELEDFQLGVEEARHHVHSTLGFPPEYMVVANVGIVCARKGQEYALEIAAQSLKDHPTTVFPFLGSLDIESPYAEHLKDQANRLKIKDMTQFLGFRRDVPMFLKGSDIFLHTPLWDPNPRVILEAMGAGLPVVAFDVDGISEMVVDGETGYLIPFGDVSAGAEALKKLLGNQSLRARMGEMGKKRVQSTFTAEETARKVGELVHNLLERTVER